MTELESTKNHPAVEASSMSLGERDEDNIETPMIAVWLSLAAILVAGLYGLYLGTSAKSKDKSDAGATHSLLQLPSIASNEIRA
ncbi:MAG TPA: hypothetical protein VIV60_22650 [Polyangiaceae bacterium]